MTTFLSRVTGAVLLNPAVYEEVEADRSATLQAMAVVLLSSLAAGVGGLGPVGARPAALAGISLLAFAVWASLGAADVPDRHPDLPLAAHAGRCRTAAAHDRIRVSAGHFPRRGSDPRLDDGGLHRYGRLDADGDDRRRSTGSRLHEHNTGVCGLCVWMGARVRYGTRDRHFLHSGIALKGRS